MELPEHIAALAAEGPRLAAAAAAAGPDAPVPTCPGWAVRDLVGHVGGVHRWATLVVSQRREQAPDQAERDACFAALDDTELVDWFRDGHAALLRALTEADPELSCWSFLPAPSPLAFWARRQAHETTIHRVDAESATGDTGDSGVIGDIDPEFASDGIDELLTGFLARSRGRLVADPPVALCVRASDTGRSWHIRIEPDRRVANREAGEADCELSGPSAALYQFLWNRADSRGIEVAGARSVLDLWRANATIHWS